MQKKKRLLSICFVFALLCALCLSAHAAVDVPDESKTGTIRVTMLYNNQPVSGGTLSVYRVGDIHEDDGNYTFVLAEKFAGSNVTWTEETLGEPEVAKALSEYAAKNSIAADKTGTIGSDGKAAQSARVHPVVSEIIPFPAQPLPRLPQTWSIGAAATGVPAGIMESFSMHRPMISPESLSSGSCSSRMPRKSSISVSYLFVRMS